jgi:phytoene synthase
MTPPSIQSILPEAMELTNRVARTFSLAIRFLPIEVRDDVYLLYYVCRVLDDLVDRRRPEARSRLEAVRRWARGGGPATGTEEIVLQHLVDRHPAIPRDAIVAFCEGQLEGLEPPVIVTEADLDRHSYLVAGTVGRIMAAILGVRDPRADVAARALGIAMQRTNILRDIDEDLREGRIYLPRETLRCFAVADLRHSDRARLLRHEIMLADAWYTQGLAGIRFLERGGRQVRAAALMYRAILRQIEADGLGQVRPHRAAVGLHRKMWLVTRALVNV